MRIVITGNAARPVFSSPIGYPILPGRSKDSRVALLNAWLRECNESHDCNTRSKEPEPTFPTRALDIGDANEPRFDAGCVRLVHASEARDQKYIALSHCWGKLSVEKEKSYCTTQENIDQRCKAFRLSELPKTFQDAVEVTRELGVQYLWIDSLCIIQHEDDKADWKREACRMETVYSHAYCTIAATAAVDSNAGFLQRDVKSDYVHVQNTSGEQFYISADIDDFDNDVGRAQLNTRAWVMQESVLSRRTIHFSANQIYWECGRGIHCENLTRLRRYDP